MAGEIFKWIMMIACASLAAHFGATLAPRMAREVARRKRMFHPKYERLSIVGLVMAIFAAPIGFGARNGAADLRPDDIA